MSTLVDVANAVRVKVDSLAVTGLAPAELTYSPLFALEAIQTIQTLVVPVSENRTIQDRGSTQKTFNIHVGILKKLDDLDDTDALIGKVEQIADSLEFSKLTLPDTRRAVWVGTRLQPYFPDQLRAFRSFIGVMDLTFRVLD